MGSNESLQNVNSDLNLKESYGDIPISVRWESGSPGRISDSGQIFSLEEEETVRISFRLSYGEWERSGSCRWY